ncbi:MAG: NHL repeat-containing protein [Clostridiales bacterium]|nr:NHL repeat-containing protein [Clostridiales bacterium]
MFGVVLAAAMAFGQTVEMVKGVRLVHNDKDGLWGKKPKIQLKLIRTLGDVNADDEALAFYMPSGLALDSQGNLYILDTGNHRIQKFGPDGDFLASLGRQGQGPGEFSYPDSIDIDSSGLIWVSDPHNKRIQVLTAEGKEAKTLSFVDERVGNIRCTKSGLVMAGGMGGFLVFRPGMEEKENALPRLFKMLDGEGNVLGEYGEPYDFRHTLLNTMGNQIKFAVDAEGAVYLAYLYQNRVEKYSPQGKLVWRADRKLDYSLEVPKDKGRLEAKGGGISVRMPRLNQCANGIAVDSAGRVWVVTMTRQAKEDEQVGVAMSMMVTGGERKMSMKVQGNTEIQKTDMYKLEIFNHEGVLLGSLAVDHFIDGIAVKGPRLFLWDGMRGAKFYEYRIEEK